MCFDPNMMAQMMGGMGGTASQEPPLKPMPPVIPRPGQAAPAAVPMPMQAQNRVPPRIG